MRKQPKSFTVEVKRRPNSLGKKAAFVEAPAPAPQPSAAALVFAPQPADKAAPADPRRILPCLVTEAAIDAARSAEEADGSLAPRPRGRPRKQRPLDDLAPLAPRKRGRPRKVPLEGSKPAPQPVRAAAPQPVRVVRTTPAAPVGESARSNARRDAANELPRGERWKRRLPKALR